MPNKTKRVLAVLLALLTVASLAFPVFAAGEGAGEPDLAACLAEIKRILDGGKWTLQAKENGADILLAADGDDVVAEMPIDPAQPVTLNATLQWLFQLVTGKNVRYLTLGGKLYQIFPDRFIREEISGGSMGTPPFVTYLQALLAQAEPAAGEETVDGVAYLTAAAQVETGREAIFYFQGGQLRRLVVKQNGAVVSTSEIQSFRAGADAKLFSIKWMHSSLLLKVITFIIRTYPTY
ncbi:MAG: hypothetical protein LBJ11_11350 [Oscillospiraceae bacterium]|jgi:hypothetical protein|nr:hypothetical protein [Oscillospiraceae bacterium]